MEPEDFVLQVNDSKRKRVNWDNIACGIKIFSFGLFKKMVLADTFASFWKRWHMSLTAFLTKYIYIPLGGSFWQLMSYGFYFALIRFRSGRLYYTRYVHFKIFQSVSEGLLGIFRLPEASVLTNIRYRAYYGDTG